MARYKDRCRNIAGLGNVTLPARRKLVATRTIYHRERMPHPVVLIFEGPELIAKFGPLPYPTACRAVADFNYKVEKNGGVW